MVDLMIDMTEEPVDEDDFEFLLTNEFIGGVPYLTCPTYPDNSYEYHKRLNEFIGYDSMINCTCFKPTLNTVAFLRP